MTAHYLTDSAYSVTGGDTVQVLAAAGGVGRLITQIASSRGAKVLGVVSDATKSAHAYSAGAHQVIVGYDAVPSATSELTAGAGVGAVYDGVGGLRFFDILVCARRRGDVVLFGSAAGEVPLLEVNQLANAGSLRLTRPRLQDYIATHEELLDRAHVVFELLAQGIISVLIGGKYPLADAAGAHQALESRSVTGKLILLPTV